MTICDIICILRSYIISAQGLRSLYNVNILLYIFDFPFPFLQAVNRAGLKSKTISVPIIFDKTPPESGQVMDGNWLDKVRPLKYSQAIDVRVKSPCTV